MNEQLLIKLSVLRKEAEELERNVQLIQFEIKEMEDFLESIDFIKKSGFNEILAPIGKGVYLKANPIEEKFFVEVGAGVFVKKTREELKEIALEQIKELKQAKIQLLGQLDSHQNRIKEITQEFSKKKV